MFSSWEEPSRKVSLKMEGWAESTVNSILAGKTACKGPGQNRFFQGPREEMLSCVGLVRLQLRAGLRQG